jgi:hypothetical protein
MSDLSKRILTKKFVDKNSKSCYLDVCKWVAQNIISKDDVCKNCSYSVKKKYKSELGLYEYTLDVYANISYSDVKKHHCRICKETHSSFFISEETNCNWCKINALEKRVEEDIKKKQKYIKEKMLEGWKD